ncbi:hypothetical protein G6045_27550 [Streptomyces sp. YC504]|uniref:DUF6294 domain-containing protein n=1 Tax=Streptomyces mesophilus TaxID=1775132 RepID=A0A6G4XQA8_9ACTN|nr:DUF6294 family protein [Streptomyces mesophilus]NGO79382.1 hypothetical protein [Streptomyces mesophilus]
MNDTKKPKKLMNRRTLGGVAVLGVAAGTLGVAMVMPPQDSPKKAGSKSVTQTATETVRATGAGDGKGIVSKAGLSSQTFTFNSARAGDCVRKYGATWKLYSNGHAYFKGHFGSNSGDDAWLMYAKLLDDQGGLIGYLRADRNPGDARKFVIGLPEAGQIYTAGRNAYFPADLWDDVRSISLTRHC